MVAESGHAFFFFVMLALTVRETMKGDWEDVATTLILNLIVNVIPIMVQRYNRARIVTALGISSSDALRLDFWTGGLALQLDPPPDRSNG
jgi:hypothetical protein